MLSANTIEAITAETSDYWAEEVKKSEIVAIAHGKEIGHKLADLIDEKTCALLTVNHITRHECKANGDARARSMGDVWLQDNEIYHPINVKTGIVGAEGQPNLVSLKKVLTAIMSRQIDSYYLLMVKISVGEEALAPAVYFVDMLDWLDYVTFDSGPGQMMLKAVSFFKDYEHGKHAELDIKGKLTELMELYKDGEKRLKMNREQDFKRYVEMFNTFTAGGEFTVTPNTQKSLLLK